MTKVLEASMIESPHTAKPQPRLCKVSSRAFVGFDWLFVVQAQIPSQSPSAALCHGLRDTKLRKRQASFLPEFDLFAIAVVDDTYDALRFLSLYVTNGQTWPALASLGRQRWLLVEAH